MFITQHSSVTVDGKLSPTVNALLSGGQDFLRLLSYWIVAGVAFRFELKNNYPAVTEASGNLPFPYSKVLPAGGKRSPDSHVSNSPARGNIRSLFICREVDLTQETFSTCNHILSLM